MKSLKHVFIALAILGLNMVKPGGLASQYGEKPWFEIVAVGGSSAINVFIQNIEGHDCSIELNGMDGQIWRESYRTAKVAKSLMLAGFPDGEYQLTATTDSRIMKRAIAVKDGEARVLDKPAQQFVSPTISVMGKYVLMDLNPTVEGSEVEAIVYDGSGREVYRHNLTTAEKRVVRFNMAALSSGTYNVTFDVDGEYFTRTVTLK